MHSLSTKKKFILGTVIGMLVSSAAALYIVNIMPFKKTMYKNNKNYLEANNAQGAVTELYSDKTYQGVKDEILNMIYPVGSLYVSVSYSSASQVHDALGGTWEAYADGRLLRGTTGTAGTTFDSNNTITLAATNIPAHTHTIPAHAHGLNNHTHSIGSLTGTSSSSGAHTHKATGTSSSSGAHTHGFNYNAKVAAGSERAHIAGSDKTATANDITTSAGAHTHTFSGTAASAGAHTHTASTTASTTGQASGNTANSAVLTSGSTGQSSPTSFSTMDPYITAYIYKRTA